MLILILILLLSTNAHADTYEKISPKIFRITTCQTQDLNIDYLKQQVADIQSKLDTEKVDIQAKINEAAKVGVS